MRFYTSPVMETNWQQQEVIVDLMFLLFASFIWLLILPRRQHRIGSRNNSPQTSCVLIWKGQITLPPNFLPRSKIFYFFVQKIYWACALYYTMMNKIHTYLYLKLIKSSFDAGPTISSYFVSYFPKTLLSGTNKYPLDYELFESTRILSDSSVFSQPSGPDYIYLVLKACLFN